MKKKVLLSMLLLTVSFISYSQPPTPNNGHGSNVTQGNLQSAPIGTSTILLITLGAAYTGGIVYFKYKRNKEKIED